MSGQHQFSLNSFSTYPSGRHQFSLNSFSTYLSSLYRWNGKIWLLVGEMGGGKMGAEELGVDELVLIASDIPRQSLAS